LNKSNLCDKISLPPFSRGYPHKATWPERYAVCEEAEANAASTISTGNGAGDAMAFVGKTNCPALPSFGFSQFYAIFFCWHRVIISISLVCCRKLKYYIEVTH